MKITNALKMVTVAKSTGTQNRTLTAGPCFMTRRIVTCVALSLWIGLTFNGSLLEAATLPTADAVLLDLHLSDSDRADIRQGKIVKWSATEGSDRELAVGMVLLAKTKATNFVELFREASAYREEKAVTAYGEIAGDGTLADFAGVRLGPNGEKEALRYLSAGPGEDLNLDVKEIAAFRALKPADGKIVVSNEQVEALVRQTLLSRYQAYRANGLAGIIPYERKNGNRLRAGDELSLSIMQMKLLAKYVPSVHTTLLNYPAVTDGQKALEEHFYWLNLDLFGRPTYALSHRMLFQVGEVYFASDRHYYTSHDYNSLQQGVTALPTKDGTLVITLVRVSTDQVDGFGSSAKHSISRALMGPYFDSLYETLRAQAEKKQ
ncbi:MAG: hypothetical protein WCH20_00845 [Nitrospira sp.]